MQKETIVKYKKLINEVDATMKDKGYSVKQACDEMGVPVWKYHQSKSALKLARAVAMGPEPIEPKKRRKKSAKPSVLQIPMAPQLFPSNRMFLLVGSSHEIMEAMKSL